MNNAEQKKELKKEERKTFTLVIKQEWIARVIQRMITTEIDNQNKWSNEEKRNGFDNEKMRTQVIDAVKELQEQLEKQGVQKYVQYI